MDARSTALRIIMDVIYKDKYSNIITENYMNKAALSEEDRRLCVNLVMGVLQNSIYLQHLLNPFVKNMQKTGNAQLEILKLGIYQIIFMDRIPDYAVVDQSADMTRKFANERSVAFVNAVLRNFIRKYSTNESRTELRTKNKDLALDIRYSCTKEACDAMLTVLNKQELEEFLEQANSPQDSYITINSTFHDIDKVIEDMQQQDYTVTLYEKNRAVVSGSTSPFHSRAYKEGAIIVQDIGAADIAALLDVQPGQEVLDACAAPGGKTIFLADVMKNTGSIIACDITKSRVEELKRNVKRCSFTNIECLQKDMTKYDAFFEKKFDKVIIDAPCSGLSTIGRRPEIKLKYKSSENLVHTQRALISTCSSYVKDKGQLVYGTCTMNYEENEAIVQWFLAQNPNAVLLHEGYSNGFYAAKIAIMLQ